MMTKMWNAFVEGKKMEQCQKPRRVAMLRADNRSTSRDVKCHNKIFIVLLIVSHVAFVYSNDVRQRDLENGHEAAIQEDPYVALTGQYPFSESTQKLEKSQKSATASKSKGLPSIYRIKNDYTGLRKDDTMLTTQKVSDDGYALWKKFQNEKSSPKADTYVASFKQAQNRFSQFDSLHESKQKTNLKDLRDDDNKMACGNRDQQTFTDIGYAFLGYNIFRGYPLAEGHDPGFTRPVFKANYTAGLKTADCRYKVPDGLFVMSDVSCVTSFSSDTLQTSSDVEKELSVSASIEGGGWGVKFSASAGYKQSSSEVAKGDSVLIISSAKCSQYFSELMFNDPPEFDEFFISWLKILSTTDDRSTYFSFFDTFGTHFPTEVTFGARFIYKHKMSSTKFEDYQRKGVNVGIEASYAGFISVGGGIHLDASQRKAASTFMENVETKTFAVGAAPPSNGNAMAWASEVASDPVPTSYKLSGMENLCTHKYMKHLRIDYKRIKRNIQSLSRKYCSHLLSNGELNFCKPQRKEILLEKTRLKIHYHEDKAPNLFACVDKCRNEVKCKAITYCSECVAGQFYYNRCYLYVEESLAKYASKGANFEKEWTSMVLTEKEKNSVIKFMDASIVGSDREIIPKSGIYTLKACMDACKKDGLCVAFTYTSNPVLKTKCKFYAETNIHGLNKEYKTMAIFF